MNVQIDIIPGGSFVARPSSVGVEEDEIRAFQKGELPEPRRAVIAEKMRCAAFMLNCSLPVGRG
jgi:hypothetical protein